MIDAQRMSTLAKLIARVERIDGCWVYQGSTNGRGTYGRMRVPQELGEAMGCPGARVQVHRLSYWLHVGPFDLELVIHHRCHNSLCVNPAHLLAVTATDNAIEANDVRWAAVEYEGEEWL